MFGYRRKIKAIQVQLDEMMKTLQTYSDAAVLIDIERKDGLNKFTFMRGEKTYTVETYSTLSDPLLEWKKELLR